MPSMAEVERDYPNTYKKFTSLGPLLEQLGNGSKGINWSMDEEVELLRQLNRTVLDDGVSRSEEHTSELQSLMRISYAVFCLKKTTNHNSDTKQIHSIQ